jgi:two-component system chemotaxis response regulator CheY
MSTKILAVDGSVDLMVTDLCMPTMDGLTPRKHVRQRPEHRFLTVVLLTENGDEMKRRGVRS